MTSFSITRKKTPFQKHKKEEEAKRKVTGQEVREGSVFQIQKSHGSEREGTWRERERGHDRERDDDRYSRDTRDYKDRSGRFDRGRNKYSGYSGRRNQDYDRSRDYEQVGAS